jgi:exonuclease V gamma subunit
LHGGAELSLAERWWLEGRVPVGPAGEQAMQVQLTAAHGFAERVAASWPATLSSTSLSAVVNGVQLDTSLRDHCEQGYFFWSPSKLFEKITKKNPWQSCNIIPKRILPAWINHLLLNMQDLPESARASRGYFEDVSISLPPLDSSQAAEHLSALVALYQQGMQEPAALLPATGWAALADGDVQAMFEKEVNASMPARRLYHALPDTTELKAYADTLWSLLRSSAEVTIND